MDKNKHIWVGSLSWVNHKYPATISCNKEQCIHRTEHARYDTTTSHGVFICDACSQQSLAKLCNSNILNNHFYLIRKTKIYFKTHIKGLIY